MAPLFLDQTGNIIVTQNSADTTAQFLVVVKAPVFEAKDGVNGVGGVGRAAGDGARG